VCGPPGSGLWFLLLKQDGSGPVKPSHQICRRHDAVGKSLTRIKAVQRVVFHERRERSARRWSQVYPNNKRQLTLSGLVWRGFEVGVGIAGFFLFVSYRNTDIHTDSRTAHDSYLRSNHFKESVLRFRKQCSAPDWRTEKQA